MRLPKAQSILLLLLPILLVAILAFAKSGERFIYPLTVSSDGNTLVYWAAENDPSVGLQLFREEGGVVSSVEFPASGLHGFGKVVATPKWIVIFLGDKVYFVDPTDFSKVQERSYFEKPGLAMDLVVSGNQRYLFYTCYLKDTNNHRSGIIDLSNLELTWRHDGSLIDTDRAYGMADNALESGRETVSVGNLLEVFSKDVAGNVIAEALEFEEGKPVPFVSKREQGDLNAVPVEVPFWNRDRSVSISVDSGNNCETIATNHKNNKSVLLGSMFDEVNVVAQSDKRVLLAKGRDRDLISLDLASLEIGKTIPSVGPSYCEALAISDDGMIARKVSSNNLTWADFLRSECGYYREYIEILDANTGQRIRISENSRGFWWYAILAFGGTIIWTFVWLQSSWQIGDSSKLISDIAVVGLLWLSFFLLRYVFGGYISGSSGGSDAPRPSEFGFMCLMTSLTGLISIWAISSRLRVSFRLPVGMIAIAGLWSFPFALWQIYDLENHGIRFECLFVAIGVSFACVVARMFGWTIAKPESATQYQSSQSIQIKLSDMLLWPVAIGLLITIFLPLMKDIGQEELLFELGIGLWLSVIVMSAFWAALSRYNLLKWFFGILHLLTLIASVSRFYFWHEDAYIITVTNTTAAEDFQFFVLRLVALSAGVGLCSLLMMCWVRRQGWRWSKVNRQRVCEVVAD